MSGMTIEDYQAIWRANKIPQNSYEDNAVILFSLPFIDEIMPAIVHWDPVKSGYVAEFGKFTNQEFHCVLIKLNKLQIRIIRKFVRRNLGLKHIIGLLEKNRKSTLPLSLQI